MLDTDPTTEELMTLAKQILDFLPTVHYNDDILGAKAIDAGIRLATQLCILRLRQIGMSYNKIKEGLEEEGISVSLDAVSSWFNGEYEPEPSNLKALIELYRSSDTAYKRAAGIRTKFKGLTL
jgi:hypothetical protein